MLHYTISVGQPHPAAPTGVPSGVRFHAGRGGVEIVAVLPGLTRLETRAWANGQTRLALVPAGTHTFFVCFDIDGFGWWSDAPFALGLAPVESRGLPPREQSEGFVVQLHLIEALTMQTRAVRLGTASRSFSAKLEELFAGQQAALGEFSQRAHDAEIEAAYRRWPTSTEMACSAEVIEVAEWVPPAR